MKPILAFIALALLSGCGGSASETDEASIANRAASLERAATATTDQMIDQINAEDNATQPVPDPRDH